MLGHSYNVSAEDRYFAELAVCLGEPTTHIANPAQSQHSPPLEDAKVAFRLDDRYLDNPDDHLVLSKTLLHETCQQDRDKQRVEFEPYNATKQDFCYETENSRLLTKISSRLDRIESISSAHQDFSQKHLLESQEVLLSLRERVSEIGSELTDLRKEVNTCIVDVGNGHGLRELAKVDVGLQCQIELQQPVETEADEMGRQDSAAISPGCGRKSISFSKSLNQHVLSAEREMKHQSAHDRVQTLKEVRVALEEVDSQYLGPGHKAKYHRQLFTDVEDMKQQVRHSILQPYDVSRYYHRGICARIAMHQYFEICALIVVSLNALWVGIDVDINGSQNTPDKDTVYQCIEYSFVSFFVSEMLIRFAAFDRKCDCLKDFWFTFDSALMALMCFDTILPLVTTNGIGFDTSFITMARLIKLSRMGRIASLLLKVPEIALLVHGFIIACRAVTCTLLLLGCLVYVFAVAFRFLTIDTELGDAHFQTVPSAMKELAITAVMPDAADMVENAGMEHVVVAILVPIYFSLASLTLLNMLVGMICEVIGVVAAMEKETTRVHMVKGHLSQVLRASGNDHIVDDLISQHEFQTMLLDASIARTLRELNVDPVGLVDFMDYIFHGGFHSKRQGQEVEQGISFDKIVELICELGGGNTATVKDVVDMRQVVINHLASIEESLDHMHLKFASLSAKDKGKRFQPRLPSDTANLHIGF